MKKANEAKSYFLCSGLDETTFEVTEFTGVDMISGPYQFEITLRSVNDDIDPEGVIGKQGTLFIHRDEEFYPYSGMISEFKFIEQNKDYCTYIVRLVPRLWALQLNIQSRIFQKMTVPKIIQKVISDAGIGDVTMDVGSYPEHEFIVQYQESDLDFISRLMESAGIFYFFKENPLLEEELSPGCTSESLVITDKPSSFLEINGETTLLYKARSGLNERIEEEAKESMHDIRFETRVIPREVVTRNYNYRTPENFPAGKSPVKGGHKGALYHFGGAAKNVSEANAEAKVESNRMASGRIQMSGECNCVGLRAGHRFTLDGDVKDRLKKKYLVTFVSHSGGHMLGTGSASQFTYKNQFRSLPEEQANIFAPEKKTPVPRIPGVITAAIEANGSPYASLDDKGRYKVRLPFDISSTKNYEGSKYVRLAQPYSGAQYGIHFPSHEGTEMILACIDGDPNKPIGIGTIPNANSISPVVSGNKQQNVIRTAGGNEMVMDDTDAKQKIWITTKGKHRIEQDDENKKLFIQTTDKNALLMDDKNQVAVWNAKNHKITMSYKSGEEGIVVTTGGGHTIKIDDKNKKITIQTTGGHTIDMDDNGKKILLADGQKKNKVTLDGNGGLILDSTGKIQIKAQQDLTIDAMNIKINAKAGLEAKAAMDFKAKGMNMELKGDMGTKINAGMNMEIKGGIQTKVDGTMLDLNGSAMTKVKGGIVMIN